MRGLSEKLTLYDKLNAKLRNRRRRDVDPLLKMMRRGGASFLGRGQKAKAAQGVSKGFGCGVALGIGVQLRAGVGVGLGVDMDAGVGMCVG